jgi:ABC-2 type transport system ATP-binding protein
MREGLKYDVVGDAFSHRTAYIEEAIRVLRQSLMLGHAPMPIGLHVAVPNGDKAIPQILSALPMDVESVALTRPTLDDVFIELTGRQLRDEEGSAMAGFRTAMASRTRQGRAF